MSDFDAGPERPAAQAAGQRRPVRIPDDLQEFLESVHIMAGDLESGTFTLSKPEDAMVWDDITWTRSVVGCPRMIGLPSEDLTEFEFKYMTPSKDGEWEFHLGREALAQVADRTVQYLSLYACANRVCGYMSSREWDRCPRCHLEPGDDPRGALSYRVRGVCPYCHEFLRRLDSTRCRNCRMDWRDPDHPTRPDAKPQGGAS